MVSGNTHPGQGQRWQTGTFSGSCGTEEKRLYRNNAYLTNPGDLSINED